MRTPSMVLLSQSYDWDYSLGQCTQKTCTSILYTAPIEREREGYNIRRQDTHKLYCTDGVHIYFTDRERGGGTISGGRILFKRMKSDLGMLTRAFSST